MAKVHYQSRDMDVTEYLCTRVNAEALSESAIDLGVIENTVETAARSAREDGTTLFETLDFEYMFKSLIDSDVLRAVYENDQQVLKESQTTIKSTAFDKIFDNCMLQIFQDFSCPEADYTLRRECVSEVDLDCRTNKICEWPMPPAPELCCEMEDEPVKWYGVGDIRCWQTPKACKTRFAFAINREMLCLDPNLRVRDQISRYVRWFDEMDEKALVRIFFNAYDCVGSSCAPSTFNYDGQTLNFWLEASDNGPWVNMIQDANLAITGVSTAPLVAIEKLWEDMRDPTNCKPLDCVDTLQIMIPCWADRYAFLDLLGTKRFRRETGGAGNELMDIEQGPREGWSTDLKYSRYILDIVQDWELNCNSAANETEAETKARNTYVVGNFRQAVGFGTEWGIETLERSGTDTYEYFDREVVWSRKYMRKATPVLLRPWMLKLIRGYAAA